MRRRLIGVLAVLCGPAVLVAASPAGAVPAGCAPAGAKVLAAAGGARMYVQGAKLYGCLGSRRTRLGGAPGARRLGATRVALAALAPRDAGIDTVTMGVDTFASQVSIVDLRSGMTVSSSPATTPEMRPESFISATALAIDAHGTLAWIGSRSAIGVSTPIYEVHTLTAAGAGRMLASSAKIAPRSLTLHGRALGWVDGGTAHKSTIAP
jgi:hypothetical protein